MKNYLFTLFLLFASYSTFAQTEIEVVIDGIAYFLREWDKTATMWYGRNPPIIYSGDIIIPPYIKYNNDVYTVTDIGDYAFDNCQELTSVVIPNTVTFTGCYVISGKKVTSVTIGSGMDDLGAGFIYDCDNLRTVICLANDVPRTAKKAFDDMSNVTLYVPEKSVEAYKNASPWSSFKAILPLPQSYVNETTMTITDAGIGTYCSNYDLDFSEVTDIKAYIISAFDYNTGKVSALRVNNCPAETGLLVKGEPGTYTIPVRPSSTYCVNLLVGATAPMTLNPTDGMNTNYILSKKNGDLGFYKVQSSGSFAPNKAYLQLPTSLVNNSNYVGLTFDDEIDGINDIAIEKNTNKEWFTIDGIKLNAAPQQKGIYIKDGKKVVIK